MQIKLLSEKIINDLPTEAEMHKHNRLLCPFIIRKLKALVDCIQNGFIDVVQKDDESVYCEKYDVSFYKTEFVNVF